MHAVPPAVRRPIYGLPPRPTAGVGGGDRDALRIRRDRGREARVLHGVRLVAVLSLGRAGGRESLPGDGRSRDPRRGEGPGRAERAGRRGRRVWEGVGGRAGAARVVRERDPGCHERHSHAEQRAEASRGFLISALLERLVDTERSLW